METARNILGESAKEGRMLREEIQDVYVGCSSLAKAAMSDDGELPAKIKELIALAIAITRECDGCIASHARGAARRGATRKEVAEAIGVAILMNGGPGTVWGPRALSAFLEFAVEHEPEREPSLVVAAGDGRRE